MLNFEPRTTKTDGVVSRIIQRVGVRRVTRAAIICAAAVLLPASYAAFGQTAPEPTPTPAASTPSGQSADPRYDQQSRKGATEAGPGTTQTSDQHFMKEAAAGGMAEVELGPVGGRQSVDCGSEGVCTANGEGSFASERPAEADRFAEGRDATNFAERKRPSNKNQAVEAVWRRVRSGLYVGYAEGPQGGHRGLSEREHKRERPGRETVRFADIADFEGSSEAGRVGQSKADQFDDWKQVIQLVARGAGLTERAPLARLLRTLLRSSSFLSSRKKKGKIVASDTSWISDRRRLLKTGTLMGLAAVTGSLAVGGVRVNAESHRDLKVPDERMPDSGDGVYVAARAV